MSWKCIHIVTLTSFFRVAHNIWSRDYKNIMLNSAEHEISCSFINIKMPTTIQYTNENSYKQYQKSKHNFKHLEHWIIPMRTTCTVTWQNSISEPNSIKINNNDQHLQTGPFWKYWKPNLSWYITTQMMLANARDLEFGQLNQASICW